MSNLVSIVNGEPLTTSIAISIGSRNEHKAVIQLVRQYRGDLEEFGRVAFEMSPFETAGGVQKREVALLNEQQATLLLTYMKNTAIIRAFKKRLVKEFFEAKKPTNVIQLLELATDELKKKQVELDHAIKTKAEIGTKREATAMARASSEKRRADQLARELGDHTLWKSAKSIDWVSNVLVSSRAMWSQFGKYLSRLSKDMGMECQSIEDSSYGTVKAYHIDVITEAYKRIKEDQDILAKYRKVSDVA